MMWWSYWDNFIRIHYIVFSYSYTRSS